MKKRYNTMLFTAVVMALTIAPAQAQAADIFWWLRRVTGAE